ncbi:MAG: S10 family serine carboxypeptidase-like protein [Verrucomicrobiales bacterium]
MRPTAVAALLLLFLPAPAANLFAQTAQAAQAERSVTISGKEIGYRASPGTITLERDNGRARGSIFYTAYHRTGLAPDQLAQRPIAFVFNGGPGSSSAWLHLGAFGPRRLVLGEAGLTEADHPYRTVANQHSLIDVADLVFIDPIGTGFSRATDIVAARGFYSFRSDVRSIAEFIKLYMAREQRLNSPCCLIGESYGAMRACGLVPELEAGHGIVVNGIVLVSGPIVMGKRVPPDQLLPTAAATAHFHGLLNPDLQALGRQELLERVGGFVDNAYRPALGEQGVDPESRDRVAAEVRAFTGLRRLRGLSFSLREVRVNACRELGVESIGIYDARVTSNARGGRFRGATGDPALALIREPMTAVMGDYLTRDLGYQTDLDYELLKRIPMWSHSGSKASDTLTRALQTNRGLKTMVACGYYDTVTPMAVVRRAVEDAEFTPAQRKNISFKNYEGGHMMYTNLPSLKQLSADVRAFIRKSSLRKRGPALVPTASTPASTSL